MNSQISKKSIIKQLQMMIRCSRINYFKHEKLIDNMENFIETGNQLIKDIEQLLKPQQPTYVYKINGNNNIINNIVINNIINVNQKRGLIYLLKNKFIDSNDIYIGSTTISLNKRFGIHKYKFNCGYLDCNSKTLFERGEVEIIEIDTIYFTDRKQLLKIEGLYMEHYRGLGFNVVNELPSTGVFSGLDSIEVGKLSNKMKYTCDCGMEYSHKNKSRHEKTKFHQNYINSLN